jgi:PAS domain S-box-containing protein
MTDRQSLSPGGDGLQAAVAWPGSITAPACLNELVCDEVGRPQDYRIIDVNEGFETLTGFHRLQAAGRLASELYGPPAESDLAKFADVTAAGTAIDLETCVGTRACRVTALPAGERRFVTVFADDHPAPAGPDIAIDFHDFFNLAPDYYFVVSPSGVIEEANPAACAALGTTRAELVGRHIRSIYAQEWQARAGKLVERWRRTGHLDNEEMVIAGRDDSRRMVLLSTRDVRDSRGRVLHSVVVQRDITLRRQAEDALRDSRDSFTELVQQIGDGVIIADADENCVSANRAAAELLGVSLSELIGHPVRRFTTVQGWQRILAETARRRTGQISSYDMEFVRPDGSTCHAVVSASPRYDVVGRYAGSLAVLHNVTRLRQAEADQAKLLRYAACSAREFGCLYAVSELLASSGAATESVLAQVADIIPAAWPHGDVAGARIVTDRRDTRSAGCTETPWSVTARAVSEAGDVGSITIYYRRDRGGSPDPPLPCDEKDLVDSIARQLASFIERRKAEDELRRAHDELEQRVRERTAELEQVNRLQHDLVDMVMHDLGTPMQIVSGYSSMIIEGLLGPVSEDQRKALEEMQLSVKTLEGLRRDMLELSRFDSAMVRLDLQPTDVAALVAECVRELSFLIHHRRHQVASFVPPLRVECDARRIRQVVTNYLSNAIRYTPDGGRIELAARIDDDWLEVSVKDNGRGIAPGEANKVFEKFRRADRRSRSSSGMGLAVVKRIVEAHGGRAWCESRLNVGSTFYFRIPVRSGSA